MKWITNGYACIVSTQRIVVAAIYCGWWDWMIKISTLYAMNKKIFVNVDSEYCVQFNSNGINAVTAAAVVLVVVVVFSLQT